MFHSLSPASLLVKNVYVGINASDLNYNDMYRADFSGPFDFVIEAISEVIENDNKVTHFHKGDFIVSKTFASFGEFMIVPEDTAIKFPSTDSIFLAMRTSDLTTAVPIEEKVRPTEGKTAVITAAAGGNGTYAVQLFKRAGCHVVGTCGSDEKVKVLKEIGVARPVNYQKENFGSVLRIEYSNSVDYDYECIVDKMFNDVLDSILLMGHIITIGSFSNYGHMVCRNLEEYRSISHMLLGSSVSLDDFYLPHYNKIIHEHFKQLIEMHNDGTVKSLVDKERTFTDFQEIPNAVQYLKSGKNKDKVVVNL